MTTTTTTTATTEELILSSSPSNNNNNNNDDDILLNNDNSSNDTLNSVDDTINNKTITTTPNILPTEDSNNNNNSSTTPLLLLRGLDGLPHHLLKDMKTNIGISVEELSRKHVVLLIFLRYFGCVFCQRSIVDIINNLSSLIKLNCVPVFVHQESTDDAEVFFSENGMPNPLVKAEEFEGKRSKFNLNNNNNSTDDNNSANNESSSSPFKARSDLMKKFLRVADPEGTYYYKQFGVHPGSSVPNNIKSIFEAIRLSLTEGYKLSSQAGEGVERGQLSATFVIAQGKIVNRFLSEAAYQIPDFLELLLDLDGKSSDDLFDLLESGKVQQQQKQTNTTSTTSTTVSASVTTTTNSPIELSEKESEQQQQHNVVVENNSNNNNNTDTKMSSTHSQQPTFVLSTTSIKSLDENYSMVKLISPPTKDRSASISSSALPKNGRKASLNNQNSIEEEEDSKKKETKKKNNTKSSSSSSGIASCFFPTTTKHIENSNIDNSNSEEFTITLQTALTNNQYRKIFKLFAAKIYAVESLLFWEQATLYQKTYDDMKRVDLSKLILDTYLDADSMLEINTSSSMKQLVMNRYRDEGAVIHLFDELVKNMECDSIMDTFLRFIESPLFEEKIAKKLKQQH